MSYFHNGWLVAAVLLVVLIERMCRMSALSKSLVAATNKIKELETDLAAATANEVDPDSVAALPALQAAAGVDVNGDPLPAAAQ